MALEDAYFSIGKWDVLWNDQDIHLANSPLGVCLVDDPALRLPDSLEAKEAGLMIDVAKRLIGKYPHIALACGGIFVFVSSFVSASNVNWILAYFGWHLAHHGWLLLTVGIAQLSSVATGIMMFGVPLSGECAGGDQTVDAT